MDVVTEYIDSYEPARYKYTLHFNANGGTPNPDDTSGDESSTSGSVTVYAPISETIPTRNGFAFAGWNTQKDGSGDTFYAGDSKGRHFSRSSTGTYETRTERTDTAAGIIYITITTHHTASNQSAYSTLYAQWTPVAVRPTFTIQPQSISVWQGDSAVLTCLAETEYGVLSYQWYTSNDRIAFRRLTGETSEILNVSTSSVGVKYYYVQAKSTASGTSYSAYSDIASVTVQTLIGPTIEEQPKSATYAIGDQAAPLRITVSTNGTISYQWMKRSQDEATWETISGATSRTYVPPTSSIGVTYYKCEVTARGGQVDGQAESSEASVTVVTATTPVFKYNLASINVTYNSGDISSSLNGIANAPSGTLSYQWYRSTDNGGTWFVIPGASTSSYEPPTTSGGVFLYRVICTNRVGSSTAAATSGSAKVTVISQILPFDGQWKEYLASVGKPFTKLARIDFLNPNGSIRFSLDNNPRNERSKAFIQSGELSVNLQNGQRRNATVTLSNLSGEFDYSINKLWFGQQVRLWEGIILPNGQDFYISQGVFYVQDPEEVFEPGLRQTTLNLVDKWAYLDGSLFGNIDGTYEIPLNSNIFNAIKSILNFDRGNGEKVDSSIPVFTNYYNGKTTTLPDGSTVPLTNTPYTYRCDSESGTYADIILELNTMLAGWIGYDANGQLRMDPSQDDILDTTKPVQWAFSPQNCTFLGATYSVKNSEVYNDIIIIGESLSEYGQTAARATNYDPQSDTNANIIGLKTKRYQQSGYYTQDICESMAVFKLKRESVLKKSVSIKCSQLFHIQENSLVTIERTDKPGNPIERHLVTGYTRPIAQNGEMTLNCTSVQDFPTATITTAP